MADKLLAYTRFRRASLQPTMAVSAPTARAISAMHHTREVRLFEIKIPCIWLPQGPSRVGLFAQRAQP